MKLLLTGPQGQLGQALQARLAQGLAGSLSDIAIELHALGRDQLDLADAQACREAVLALQPDWVLNAGAYTAVDRAEHEPDLARAVNALAPQALAQALAELGRGRLLQLSTDFVFAGDQGHPYAPEPLPAGAVQALGVYGQTKAEGEQAVLDQLGAAGRATVLRTSWAYGPLGRNFCLTMVRLHRERALIGETLAVVADQVGCPTATSGPAGLADACCRLIEQVAAERPVPAVLHWSDAGAASWYDFAVAIGDEAVAAGLLAAAAAVLPITTADYPTPARRPGYSLLDCSSSREALGLQPLHWRAALRGVLQQLVAAA